MSIVINDSKTEPNIGSVFDYIALLKPRVMSLAIFTALVGQCLALKNSQMHPILFIISLISIAMGAGAAGCINMWYERDIDAKMDRTKNRPLPKGLVSADEAIALGVILSIISTVLLTLASNYLAGFLLASSILFYIFVYTIWLKRRTYYNIVIGGAAGALPPLIGWVSVSGEINLYPLILFLLIFVWTPPHFWALSLYTKNDYKKVKIPMLPVIVGKKKTIRSIVRYSYFLYLTSLLPFLFGFSGTFYMFFALILSSTFLYFAKKINEKSINSAKHLFKFSILYLFILFLAAVADSFIYLN